MVGELALGAVAWSFVWSDSLEWGLEKRSLDGCQQYSEMNETILAKPSYKLSICRFTLFSRRGHATQRILFGAPHDRNTYFVISAIRQSIYWISHLEKSH